MSNAVVLTLDIGTSSVRAMLFDTAGKVLPDQEVQLPYAQRTTADGGVEADAEILLAQTVDCVRQLLLKTDPGVLSRLAGVGISCFWHSLVGVGEEGRAKTPVYSWADTRSREQALALHRVLDEDAYHARTGCVLHPSYWPAKLCWLQKDHPDLFTPVHRWMSFGEYLLLRLFGQTECSLSMASGTGLFNQNGANWDEQTLVALPIRREQLLPLAERRQGQKGLTPEFAGVLARLKDLPWFPAIGDGACSNVGSGAVTQDRIAINVGTSGAMRIGVEATQVDIPEGLFCYRIDRERFLLGGAFSCAGNVYAWQLETLKIGAHQAATRRMGLMPPDGHGLTVLPFWAGERSPGWHLDAQAAITGLNLHTTSLDILQASLEAVTYTFADVLDRLQAGYPAAKEIIVSGGAILHNPAWAQIMADVFGCPVTISEIAEASSRGAALLALDSLGLIGGLAASPLDPGQVYEPSPERHQVYRKARARYQALYQTLLNPPGKAP